MQQSSIAITFLHLKQAGATPAQTDFQEEAKSCQCSAGYQINVLPSTTTCTSCHMQTFCRFLRVSCTPSCTFAEENSFKFMFESILSSCWTRFFFITVLAFWQYSQSATKRNPHFSGRKETHQQVLCKLFFVHVFVLFIHLASKILPIVKIKQKFQNRGTGYNEWAE